MLMEIKIESTALMSATSRIGLAMNNEFKFYISYLIFKKLRDENVITQREFKDLTQKLSKKYNADILSFMLDIA
ncbi:SHOCT domain-containing protein [Anaerococcus porci]|uniref:SHOCT domain-containing protein n=2 Tax=Anaerococcus TaxID=165779 RepID=UPI003898D649